jgi:hypothetical protein
MDSLSKDMQEQQKILKTILTSFNAIDKENEKQSDKLILLGVLKKELKSIEINSLKLRLEPSFLSQIHERVNILKARIAELETNAKSDFGKGLNELLIKENYYLEGNYPKLKNGFYTIIADVGSNNVKIYYGNESDLLEQCNANPTDVVIKLKQCDGNIKNRLFIEEEFIKLLFDSYELCRLKNKLQDFEAVSVSDIISMLSYLSQDEIFLKNPKKKYYKEYDRVQFSYDLYRLKKKIINNRELVLVTATISDTKNKMGFLWVPKNEKGEMFACSRIKFSEVKQ